MQCGLNLSTLLDLLHNKLSIEKTWATSKSCKYTILEKLQEVKNKLIQIDN